jgi:hypothetical protein
MRHTPAKRQGARLRCCGTPATGQAPGERQPGPFWPGSPHVPHPAPRRAAGGVAVAQKTDRLSLAYELPAEAACRLRFLLAQPWCEQELDLGTAVRLLEPTSDPFSVDHDDRRQLFDREAPNELGPLFCLYAVQDEGVVVSSRLEHLREKGLHSAAPSRGFRVEEDELRLLRLPGEIRLRVSVENSCHSSTSRADRPSNRDTSGPTRAEHDDRTIILKRPTPAVGDGLQNCHGCNGGARVLDLGNGVADALDSERAAALRAVFVMPSTRYACGWPQLTQVTVLRSPRSAHAGPPAQAAAESGIETAFKPRVAFRLIRDNRSPLRSGSRTKRRGLRGCTALDRVPGTVAFAEPGSPRRR